MENLDKYGEMNIKSGNKADEIVELLIQNGFEVSRESFDYTYTLYQIFKKTQ